MSIWTFLQGLKSYLPDCSFTTRDNSLIKTERSTTTTNGSGNVVNGDNSTIQITYSDEKIKQSQKEESLERFNAAERDLDYNGPGVGNPNSKFDVQGIKQLIAYSGPWALNNEDKARFKEYLNNAGTCNGRDGGNRHINPGFVQSQSKELKSIIETYKQKISE